MHLSTSSRSIFASMIISSSSNGVSTDADADDADGADDADDACGERNGCACFILEFIAAM